jgi:hypothetical protein
MRTASPLIRGRRGVSLVLTAVSLTTLLGIGVLAMDLGILYKARAQARQAAEAGALAGASAFLDFREASAAENEAEDRAVEYATANTIFGRDIDEEDVQVAVDGQKVSVGVEREMGTWFSRFVSTRGSVMVRARAAAAVERGDAATCVAPLAIPDLWREATQGQNDQDVNDNSVEDGNERWTYAGTGNGNGRDQYGAWDPPGSNQTGYGSSLRNSTPDASGYRPTGDFGRQLVFRPQTDERRNGPTNFDFWRFDGNGGPSLEDRLEECDDRAVAVGDEYRVVTSSPPSIDDELRSMINRDPSAQWNNGQIRNSRFSDWRSSPRVIKVAVYDPSSIGQSEIEVNNVALLFLESVTNSDEITARFLYYVNGSSGDEDPDGGSLIKHVRLVE